MNNNTKKLIAITFALIMVLSGLAALDAGISAQNTPPPHIAPDSTYEYENATYGNSFADGSTNHSRIDLGQTIYITLSVNAGSYLNGMYGCLYYNGSSVKSIEPSSSGTHSERYTRTPSSPGSKSWNTAVNYEGNKVSTSGTGKITVEPDPTVSISASKSTIDAGQSVSLTSSISGGISPYTYSWTVTSGGNGYLDELSSSTSSSPTFTPTSSGTYTLTLKITDSHGYTASASTTITVDSDPSISISAVSNPSDAGQTVDFSTTASGGSGTYSSYSYILYDGTSTSDSELASGTTSSFSYTFSNSGSYLLDYSVTDSNGYTSSSSLTQSVNTDPSVSISSSQNPTDSGNTVEFSSVVSGGTSPYNYTWSANGNTYYTKDINVTFSSSGTYTIDLTVKDAAGYSVSSSLSQTVNSDPTVSASSNVTSADVNYPIEFSSSPSGGTAPYTYSWVIGGTQVSTSQDFSYSFSTAGTYTVTVTVTDALGETYSSSITITINNNPSVVVSSSQNPTDAGNSVTFTASGTGGTGTLSYAWYVNGASEGAGNSLDYSFSSTGTYTIEVIVTDSDGHTSSASLTETVYSDPSVSISSSQNPTDVGNNVTFMASPSGGSGSYSYQWYESGSAISGATSSTYTTSFSSSGTYDFYVIITDSVGNSAQSSTIDETVNADPSVSISSSQNPTDIGNSVTFTATASGGSGSYSYQWYINGTAISGATSSTYTTTFQYSGAPQFYVIVKDSIGDSAKSNIITQTINPDPSVSISSSQNPTDAGNSVTFTASGTGGTGTFSYTWYLDGATQSSTTSTFSYSFSSSGTYYINVTVKDSIGHSASYSLKESVNPDPAVSISSSQNPTDVGKSILLSALASGGTGPYTYTWYSGSTAEQSGSFYVYYIHLHNIPSGTGYYQQLLTINNPSQYGINTAGSNIQFASSNGTLLYAWEQSINSTSMQVWVKNFNGSSTINMQVLPSFENLFSANGYLGTNPSISATTNNWAEMIKGLSLNSIQANPNDFVGYGSGATGWENVSGVLRQTLLSNANDGGNGAVAVLQNQGAFYNDRSYSLTMTFNYTGATDPRIGSVSNMYPYGSNGSAYTARTGYRFIMTGTTNTGHAVSFLNDQVDWVDTGDYITSAGTDYTLVVTNNNGSYSYSLYAGSGTSGTLLYSASGISYSANNRQGQNFGFLGISDSATSQSYLSGGGSLPMNVTSMSISILGAPSIMPTYTISSQSNSSIYFQVPSYSVPSYTSSGTYSYSLKLTDGAGYAVDSNTIDETVNSHPAVSISSSQNPTDVGNNVTFTASPSAGTSPYSYAWYIDGTLQSSTSSTMAASFSSSGSYTIEVIATDSVGLKAYYNFTETVNADPSVSVSSSQNPTDIGNSVTFTATASSGTSPYSYQWYWSNGTAISGATSYEYTNSFSASGSYGFYVIIKDANGNTAQSSTLTETVNPDPSVTVSESPSPTDTGVPVEFTSSPSGGTGSYNYTWDINGVNYYTKDVNITFAVAGTYTASLVIRDANGNTATASESIVVNHQPEVSISVEYNPVYAGTNDLFSASGSYGSGAYNYTWLNNSAVIGYGAYLTYKFGAAGTYTIEVQIRDGLGQTNTSAVSVTVESEPDVAIAGPLNIDYGITNYWGITISGAISGGTVYWFVDNLNQTSDVNDLQISLLYHNVSITSLPIEAAYHEQGKWYNTTIDVAIHNQPAVSINSQYLSIDAGVQDRFISLITGGSPGYTYSWHIDGTVISSENLSYSFSTAGTYTIKLTVTDGDGATASTETNITVVSDPSVTAKVNVPQADAGYAVTFIASTSSGTSPYTYQWYWANGTAISGGTSDLYTIAFESTGTYDIYVVATDSFGLTVQSNVVSILIVNEPTVSISENRTSLDAGQSVQFSSGISGGTAPYTYAWAISGSSVSTASSFAYQFTSPGTYKVTLQITDSDGYSSVAAVNITVYSDPSVSLSYTYPAIDIGFSDTFTASASGGLSPYTYEWYIDGNAVSSSSAFSYTFTATGTYKIVLDMADSNGFSVSKNITITVNPLPQVTSTIKYISIDTGINDFFNATGSLGTAPYNYTWYSGSNVIGYGSDIVYSFTSPGSYTIKVVLRDAFTSVSDSVTVEAYSLPSAAILASSNGTDAGGSISFEGGYSNGVGPYNYTWTINGAVVSYSLDFTYKFINVGTYYVNLTVRDSFGETGRASVMITVYANPSVSISRQYSTIDQGQYDIITPIITGGHGPYSYSWYISGIGIVSTQSSLDYDFTAAGTYSITLTITDEYGNRANATVTVSVDPALTAKLIIPYSTVDENITENISLIASNGTAPYTYAIFLDGAPVSSSDAYSKYFTSAGTYSIVAYVNDSMGESVELRSTITVRSNPSISISSPVNITDANVALNFRGILSGGTGPYTYSWLIGGHTYTNSTLSYAFSTPGNYEVQLTVSDSFGREAIDTTNVTILPDPHASLVAPSYIKASQGTPLSLNITGGLKPYAVHWIFPSGEQLSAMHITHAFSTAGPDTFEAKVTDSTGYIDTQNFTVDVHLFVAIAANETSGLGPLAVQFSSSVLGGSGYSYNWTFSSGHYSLIADPQYTFPTGNYTVHFTVLSANGATGSANITIESLPAPVIISYSSGLNITQTFNFSGKDAWYVTGSYNMTWSFPNGQSITGMNITYQFPVYNEINTVIVTFSYDNTTYTKDISVRMVPAIPSISWTLPTQIPTGTMLSLNATVSDPDSSAYTFNWDVNGTLYSGNGATVLFSNAGTYHIELTVTDSLGASASENKTIDVLTPGHSSSITISISKSTSGPNIYFHVSISSLSTISSVQAYIASSPVTITRVSGNNTVGQYNVSVSQRDYNAGVYGLTVDVFASNGASNSATESFSVSSQYSTSTFNLVAFFGGLDNMIMIILTLAGVIATLVFTRPKATDIDIDGTVLGGRKGKPVKVLKVPKKQKVRK